MVWTALGLVIVWGVCGAALVVFNRLVRLRNRAASSWSDIDVQLKRRHDLVGNLVEVVKGHAHHERQVLEKAAAPRSHGSSGFDGGGFSGGGGGGGGTR